jgi:hypothetical protein
MRVYSDFYRTNRVFPPLLRKISSMTTDEEYVQLEKKSERSGDKPKPLKNESVLSEYETESSDDELDLSQPMGQQLNSHHLNCDNIE